jgi:hypothetical protein
MSAESPRVGFSRLVGFAKAHPSLVAACAALGVVLAVGGCPRGAATPAFGGAERGGVRLVVLGAGVVPAGPRVQARAGDFLLESDRLHLVIGAKPKQGHDQAGVILDATAGRWRDDQLSGLVVVAEIDGQPVPLVLRDVRPDVSGERPRLSLVHESEHGEILLETTIDLVPGEPRAEITTRVHNRRVIPLHVRVGDRVRWHGMPPFAPGVGFVEHDFEAVAPWVATAGRRQSYGLAFPSQPATVRFIEYEHGPDEQVALSPELVVAPASSETHVRDLLVVPGALEALAERAWPLTGAALGSVEGELDRSLRWAVVEARDAAGRLLLPVETSGAHFRVPVPAGSYQMVLRAPGGVDSQPAVVEAGRSSSVHFIVPRSAELTYRVNDETGRALPARFVVRGVPPTVNPNLGPWHLASGAANVACSENGAGSLQLPPGRYSVVVTHGPEYTISEQEVEVGVAQGATLRATLSHVVDTTGWVAADFHLHAEPSGDSQVSLHDRVVSLLSEGIDLAVATDHNHITDYGPTVAEMAAGEQISTAPGIEITTRDWGHFNAYPYSPKNPVPPYAVAAPDKLFEFVRATAPGVVVQVNHPRMGDIGYFNDGKFELDPPHGKPGFSLDFDTLEVWNGFDLAKLAVLDSNMEEWMALLARGRRYTAVGNSDSHRIVYEWAGYPRTYVKVDDDRPGQVKIEAVAEALRAGRAIVTSGPFIDFHVNGQGPGALVRAADGTVSLDVEVRAPPWIGVERAEILLDGKLALLVNSNVPAGADASTKLRFIGGLPVNRDCFVLVRVHGTTTLARVLPGTSVVPVAFTNPVFVDVDGDGKWTAPDLGVDAGAGAPH